MARNLEELRRRYNKSASGPRGAMPMMRGGPRRDPSMKGKPKDMKKTVKRLLSYVGEYKISLVLVIICMLFTATTSLVGSYMIAPIIDRITLEIKPDAEIVMSPAEKIVDGIITKGKAHIDESLITRESYSKSKKKDVTKYKPQSNEYHI